MSSSGTKWNQAMLDEEKELIQMLDDAESFPLHETPPDRTHLQKFEEMARNFNLSRRTVTFKPQEHVLEKFKARAAKEGIPYQALLNSVMKKYAEGSLVQKEEMFTVK